MLINAMAPLVVGDPVDLNSEQSQKARQAYLEDCKRGKEAGLTASSSDVWWALVEKVEGQYDWTYPDMLLDICIKAGLKWNPILSFHRCGGNVGDTRTVLLPEWLWTKLATKVASQDPDALKYVSEQGNASNEFISCWAIDLVLPHYRAFFKAFQAHYADKAQHILEVNISLGPAGELRFPSYNNHDKHTDFPNRGALQCYSELALKSFRAWLLGKYGSEDATRKAWISESGKLDLSDVASCIRYAWSAGHDFVPPTDADVFFKYEVHTKTRYGKDVFDWQSDSLLSAAAKVMTAAIEEFGSEGSAFKGIDVGAKVPGVHWRMGHRDGDKIVWEGRLAELPAGMLRTSEIADWDSDAKGHGYARIVGFFKELQSVRPSTRVVMHFTCLEKADGEDAHRHAESLARSLVKWVGAEARRQGVPIKGENALAWCINDVASWQMMRTALKMPGEEGDYEGLTLLRLSNVVYSDVALGALKHIMDTCKAAAATVIEAAPNTGSDTKAA
ncbi:MAG TPA: family 14 glycosylhydrolase [Planktothrix sp.]|jgi:hypothetical protein